MGPSCNPSWPEEMAFCKAPSNLPQWLFNQLVRWHTGNRESGSLEVRLIKRLPAWSDWECQRINARGNSHHSNNRELQERGHCALWSLCHLSLSKANFKKCLLSYFFRQKTQNWAPDGILLPHVATAPFRLQGPYRQAPKPSASKLVWPKHLCSTQIVSLFVEALAPSSCLVLNKCLLIN